ncbi:helix-turn-helix domain-containing protein [Rhodococcus sp. CSLK01-03]|uniref:Helix-turn-helix domain-containing protein n=1 Tax=Rhodococcus indonesiensis TaxID=3055869 RepID=A0ABT7RV50_9NOCA|nr:helix-turn-helix domain-containing protein [Rhodococcus indonesiensis]MDM7490856.1 helix-turn-helix domain-containing protein [Rhodococcus indonesiensis]
MDRPSRQYRGKSAEQRTADRREQLLKAGLTVFGREGGDRATMTAICQEAGLTERYFYESFSGRDELLVCVVERIADEIRERALAALAESERGPEERARAAIAAFVAVLTDDPRKGRVAVVESTGSEPVRVRRRELLRQFAGLVAVESRELWGDRALQPPHDQIAALLFVGGLAELTTAWLGGEIDVTPDQIVEAATRQYAFTAHR